MEAVRPVLNKGCFNKDSKSSQTGENTCGVQLQARGPLSPDRLAGRMGFTEEQLHQ